MICVSGVRPVCSLSSGTNWHQPQQQMDPHDVQKEEGETVSADVSGRKASAVYRADTGGAVS